MYTTILCPHMIFDSYYHTPTNVTCFPTPSRPNAGERGLASPLPVDLLNVDLHSIPPYPKSSQPSQACYISR